MIDGRHVAITLFEDQLVRVYFSGRRDCLISRIAQNRRITIFTSQELLDSVNSHLENLGLEKAHVCLFHPTKGGAIYRLLSFLLRWSIRSGTVYVAIQSDRTSRFLVRRLVYSLSRIFPQGRSVIRSLFLFTLPKKKIERALQFSSDEMASIDSVFITSLTNLYQDVSVAVYFRHIGKKVVGTVRSWDNLTSHGALHFVPDEFYSHSPWMHHAAVKFQGIRGDLIKLWISPPHQHHFLSNQNTQRETKSNKATTRVLYASMGLETNPDDLNMMNWICQVWPELPKHFELTVLQHPKFIVYPEVVRERTSIVRFNYSSSELKDYYDFIQSHDLIIGGGTSVILDATFAEKPIVLTKFELKPQAYWKSHLRYFDFLDHSKTLFELGGYSVAKSPSQLISLIVERDYKTPTLDAKHYFSSENLT